jgi:hypothetical protein
MKKLISSFLFMLGLTAGAHAQSNSWSKDDRNSLYNDCSSYLAKYPSLSVEQKESMGLCYLDEITKKYSKADYATKIEIELRRIRESVTTNCAKNLGLQLSEQSKEEPKKVVESGEMVPDKDNLVGHWRDNDGEFWFFESGDYKMQYNSGKKEKGSK